MTFSAPVILVTADGGAAVWGGAILHILSRACPVFKFAVEG